MLDSYLEKIRRNKPLYYFLSGFGISILGISVSMLIFGQNIGLAAVFLISLAAISLVDEKFSISQLLLGKKSKSEYEGLYMWETVSTNKKITLSAIYDDHKDLFKTYFFLFLGIMLCFSVITLVFPVEQTSNLFGEQFKIIEGNAFNRTDLFFDFLVNNLQVLFIGFFLALLFEFGTTFIIVWNASVWGTAFALAAKEATIFNIGDPFFNFFIIIIAVLTYLPFEISAYFSSSISGGLLNRIFAKEKFLSKKFIIIAKHSFILLGFGIILLGAGALIEINIIELFEILR